MNSRNLTPQFSGHRRRHRRSERNRSRAGSAAVSNPSPGASSSGSPPIPCAVFDRPTAIEMLKKLQVKYVSIKDVHLKIGAPPEETKAGRAEFDAAGFVVTSGGNVDMTKGTTVEDLRKQFEYAKAAGLPMMVCAPTHENIKAVESLVKEYNIRIAIHNHGPEDKHFPTPQSVLEVVRKLDKRCGLCMDIGHSARTGVDVVETIAGAGDRLFDMHVKDLRDMKVKDSQCDIGDGACPSRPFSNSSRKWAIPAASIWSTRSTSRIRPWVCSVRSATCAASLRPGRANAQHHHRYEARREASSSPRKSRSASLVWRTPACSPLRT